MSVKILQGDCRQILGTLPPESVHCVVTSPPYFGLRDYGIEAQAWGGDASCAHDWADATVRDRRHYPEIDPSDKQATNVGSHQRGVKPGDFCRHCGAWRGSFGLEPTVDLYIDHLVAIFRAVHRVLRQDGTLWLNLGDSYAGSWGAQSRQTSESDDPSWHSSQIKNHPKRASHTGALRSGGVKPKDLYGVPWLAAFALRSAGWFLRRDIIWSKPNPMPESATDRPTSAHEYLFLLSKSGRYHYDSEAIKEPSISDDLRRPYGSQGSWDLDGRPEEQRPKGKPRRVKMPDGWDTGEGGHGSFHRAGREKGKMRPVELAKTFRGGSYVGGEPGPRTETGNTYATEGFSRNKRSVWTIATAPFPEAHFATFPPALVEPCILAGCPEGGAVLDPFGGSGTVGLVADRLKRNAILIDLNPEYAAMAKRRIEADAGLFAEVA